MPRAFRDRRHLPHREVQGGIVCVTWRLHPRQSILVPAERDLVFGVIDRTPAGQCAILAGVVMDDHVHVLARLHGGTLMARLAQSWKSVSAHELARGGGRRAPCWQAEYFDRWMSSAAQTDACINDILQNPQRRWPEVSGYPWVMLPPKAR